MEEQKKEKRAGNGRLLFTLAVVTVLMLTLGKAEPAKAAVIQGQQDVLQQGDRVQLSVRLGDKERKKWKLQAVEWKSSSLKIAKIQKKTGKLTARKPGVTSVSAIVTLRNADRVCKKKRITATLRVMPSTKRLLAKNELLRIIPDTTVRIQQRYKQMSVRFDYYYSWQNGNYYFADETILNGVSISRNVLKDRRSYKYYEGYELEAMLGEKYEDFYGSLWSLYHVYDGQEFTDFSEQGDTCVITSRIRWKKLPEGEYTQYQNYGEGGSVEYVDVFSKKNLRLLDRKKFYLAPDGTRRELIEWAYTYDVEMPSYEVMDTILTGTEMKEITVVLDPGTKEEKTEEFAVEKSVDVKIYYPEEYQPFEDAAGTIAWDGTKSLYGHTVYLIRKNKIQIK